MSEVGLMLDDVCQFIVDCLHKTAPLQTEGFPSIRTPNVGRGRLILDGVNRVSEATYQEWTQRAVPEAGDLILAREAPAGNVAVIKEGQVVCLGQRTVHLRPNRAKVDPDFLCYYLLAPQQQAHLLAGATGATAKHVNMRDIRRLPLGPLPTLHSQRKFAQAIACYDDLIENNRKRITLLEEAARLLYREWFVQLRFPGHEHVSTQDGRPEGWEPVTLTEVCASVEDGDWIETKDQGGSDYRLLQISNIGVNDFVETGNFRFVTEETFNRLRCRELLPGHLLVARMPKPIGRAWLVTEMPWRMITAVDGAIVVPDAERADPYFLTYFINSPANLALCERRAVGATRPRITRRDVASLPLLLPPMRLQKMFREQVEPLNRQRELLRRQSDRLAETRDLLLPRLMSGALTI